MVKELLISIIASIVYGILCAIAGVIWRKISQKRKSKRVAETTSDTAEDRVETATSGVETTSIPETLAPVTKDNVAERQKPTKTKRAKPTRECAPVKLSKFVKILFIFVLPSLMFVAGILFFGIFFSDKIFLNTTKGILFLTGVGLVFLSCVYATALCITLLVIFNKKNNKLYDYTLDKYINAAICVLIFALFVVVMGGPITAVTVLDPPYYYSSHNGEVVYVLENGELSVEIHNPDVEELVIPEQIGGNPVTSVTSWQDVNYTVRKIVIPSSVTNIKGGAFGKCRNLESLEVAKGNTVYHSDGNCVIETATQTLVAGCKNSVIPSGGEVTSIGYHSFYNCDSLTSFVIPNGVVRIDSYAFENCYSLAHVTFSQSLSVIEQNAFFGCYALVEICNDSPIGVALSVLHSYTSDSGSSYLNFDYDDYIFYSDGESNALIRYLGCEDSPTLPQDYKGENYYVYYHAFGHNANIVDVVVPDSVTSVDAFVFAYSTNLSKVKLPQGLTEIRAAMFVGCKSLISVNLPQGVMSIGNYAFMSCESLTSIVIPKNVKTIGESAFAQCTGLKKVIFEYITDWQADGIWISSSDLSDYNRIIDLLVNWYSDKEWTRFR